ncbi:MAG TPA: c-type cytochrome [Gammaproteobacteria bacterium]
MKNNVWSSMTALALALCVGSALAQAKVDFGKREYESKCASCHGMSAKGDGYMRPFLTKSPADLTVLAKANQGVFPMNRLYESIEGGTVASHGTRDMPVWGKEYRIGAAAYYVDVDYDAEAYVRMRILALLEYLNRLQVR